MNLSDGLEAPNEGEWNYTVRFEDIDRLADAGFDTIRLPVRWSAHAGNWGRYPLDEAVLARTDEIIQYAISKEMNIILDVHHYYELNSRPSRHERRLEAIWQQLAEHYRNYPDKLIFEVLNEPHDKMTVKRTDALNARIVKRIRRSNPDRWVILATAEWGSIKGLLASAPPSDPHLILSWHYYEPFKFTHMNDRDVASQKPGTSNWGSNKDINRVIEDFRKVTAFRDSHGKPLLLGEFGVRRTVAVEDRAKWVGTVRHLAETSDFGWCHWGFSSNFRAYDPEQEAWIEPIRAALLDD